MAKKHGFIPGDLLGEAAFARGPTQTHPLYRKLNVGCVYELNTPDDIPLPRLGDLLCAVQERFPTWSLVPWFFAENNRRGKYKLVAIRSQNWRGYEPVSDSEHLWEQREGELSELCEFIRGFSFGAQDGAAARELESRRTSSYPS